jgi:hypothetical protein
MPGKVRLSGMKERSDRDFTRKLGLIKLLGFCSMLYYAAAAFSLCKPFLGDIGKASGYPMVNKTLILSPIWTGFQNNMHLDILC